MVLYPVRVQFTAKCWKPSRINIMQLVHKIKADSSGSSLRFDSEDQKQLDLQIMQIGIKN
jgi:hypothetical protein